jgi:5'-3' exonuclease
VDKVLLIDAHNAMWRACVTFGPPVTHIACAQCANNKHPAALHCVCGASWSEEDRFCYGDRYVFVYNFFRNLRPVIENFEPVKCFFVLEGHPQFRYDLFTDYKANRIIKRASRQEANDKFLKAKDIIVPLMQHLPITTCLAADYEADDVIGSLCENMKEEELTVISNDSDYIQLLQRGYPEMRVYNPIKKDFMQAPTYPYVAWKCLNGDKSDNIPALLKPKKALEAATNPEAFKQFMAVQENFSNFQVNRQLIEFRAVPEEEIILKEGARNFAFLQQAFEQMKFASIINDKSWDTFCKTFNCLKY